MSQTLPTPLQPPTNLTTQDIMDLPIIFADDDMLEGALTHADVTPQIVNTQPKANKFMVVNKPTNNFIISPNSTPNKSSTQTKLTPKYTKIILSSKRTPSETNTTNVTKMPNLSEISLKKIPTEVPSIEHFDLENEIVASTLFKPIPPGDFSIASPTPEDLSKTAKPREVIGESEAGGTKRTELETETESPPSKVPKLES